MADSQAEEEEASTFSLKNTSSTFTGRSNDVFGCLTALEEKHEAHEKRRTESGDLLKDQALLKDDPEEESRRFEDRKRKASDSQESDRRSGRDSRDRDGECSGRREYQDNQSSDTSRTSRDDENRPKSQSFHFRRPRGRAPARQQNRAPDFSKHPERWTYYSLEDVEGEDMSESSNKRAAFDFLEERRKLREQESGETRFDTSAAACSKGIISFSKKSKTSSNTAGQSTPKETSSTTVSLPLSDGDGTTSEASSTFEGSSAQLFSQPEKEEQTVPDSTSTGTSFKKSRKGMRRNIRTRDTDDD